MLSLDLFLKAGKSKSYEKFLMFVSTDFYVCAPKGKYPLSRTYIITPNAHTSQENPYSSLSKISGAIKFGVPNLVWSPLNQSFYGIYFDNPKSIIFTSPF